MSIENKSFAGSVLEIAKMSNTLDGLGLSRELCLNEIVIEGVRSADPKPLHHNKRNAIGEGIVFVLILLEIQPAFLKKVFINMNHFHGGAAKKPVPDLNGLGVMSAAFEKCDDFIEHIGRRYQLRQRLGSLLPMLQRRWVVLVVGEFKRQQIAGIDENQCHCEVR